MPANPNHDALRHATATTLREDAKLMRVLVNVRPGAADATFERLASLAEAVATMQERAERSAPSLPPSFAPFWGVDQFGEASFDFGDRAAERRSRSLTAACAA
jgi:hypothetical protein